MSADDLRKAAIEEEQRLLAELQKTALYKQLAAVRAVIAAYPVTSVPKLAEVVAEVRRPTDGTGSFSAMVRGSKTAAIVSNTESFLRIHGKRATSGEITRALQAAGVVAEDASAKLVSSYLSNSDLFDNDEGGYGLVEWKKAAAE
jgi:hypothetical protein